MIRHRAYEVILSKGSIWGNFWLISFDIWTFSKLLVILFYCILLIIGYFKQYCCKHSYTSLFMSIHFSISLAEIQRLRRLFHNVCVFQRLYQFRLHQHCIKVSISSTPTNSYNISSLWNFVFLSSLMQCHMVK